MCAIFGIIGDYNKNLLKKMSRVQKYRGPDKTSYFLCKKNNISLGMNRLAVIDRKLGSQPMYSYDQKIISIFNGTIYNFTEIKKFLQKKNIDFKTNCDTEVLVNAFSYWGEKSFNFFDGMWAAAFYNFSNKTFTLSRDYLGQKPLYYSKLNKEKLIFSSQLDGLFKYNKKFEFNHNNLQLFYKFGFCPAPYTLYKNILQVSPGEIINFSKFFKRKNFWDLKKGPNYNIFFKRSNRNDFKNKFDQLIKKFLISDKLPILSLSSGLDSNIIRLKLEELNIKINKITIGFQNKTFDEVHNIKSIKNLKKKVMNKKDILSSFLQIKKKISFANGDGSLIPSYFLFKNIKKKTNVSNGGDGGDEIFYGYITFKAFWILLIIRKFLPLFCLKFFKKFFKKIKFSDEYIDNRKKFNLFFKYIDKDPSLINSYWINDIEDKDIKILCPSKTIHPEIKKLKKIYNSYKSKMKFCQYYYIKYYLPMVLDKIDNASMFNSVENRSIFLSKEFLNFTLDQPVDKNFDIFKNKKLLLNILNKNLLNKISKQPKHGFAFPKNIILKNRKLIEKVVNKKFLTNSDFFRNKYNEYFLNNGNEAYLWNELILNLTRQNLEN